MSQKQGDDKKVFLENGSGEFYRENISILFCLAEENAQFFGQKSKQTGVTEKILHLCLSVAKTSRELQNHLKTISHFAPRFDLDDTLPRNGFRSMIAVADRLFEHLIRILKKICAKRGSRFFKSRHGVLKEFQAYAAVLLCLNVLYGKAAFLVKEWPAGELLPVSKDPEFFAKVILEMETEDLSCFYGRAIGFQFCDSVQRWFRFFNGLFAIYYARRITNGNRLLTLVRLLKNPEELGKMKFQCLRNMDLQYHRGFWDIAERSPIIKTFNEMPMVKVAVNGYIYVPADCPLYVTGKHGKTIQVPPPGGAGDLEFKNIPVRLISAKKRQGMKGKDRDVPSCPYLIFHVHGGGFVANTSRSHQGYLRSWAKRLDIPIVSLDYSLAPENPYPRALQETLYFYAWVLNNPEKLGWTGEEIIFVGDSAGGNLCAGAALRALDLGFGRLPNGMVLFYPSMCAQFYPSPARFLSFMDPLIPFHTLIRCLAAYFGYQNADDSPCEGIEDLGAKIRAITPYTDDMGISPLGADKTLLKQLPPIYIQCGDMDPTLDGSIMFTKHVRQAGGQANLDITSAISHGFLLHTTSSKECKIAEDVAINRMRTCLNMPQNVS